MRTKVFQFYFLRFENNTFELGMEVQVLNLFNTLNILVNNRNLNINR